MKTCAVCPSCAYNRSHCPTRENYVRSALRHFGRAHRPDIAETSAAPARWRASSVRALATIALAAPDKLGLALELLERVELAFALADGDDKLSKAVGSFLLPVLLKAGSPDVAVKQKVRGVRRNRRATELMCLRRTGCRDPCSCERAPQKIEHRRAPARRPRRPAARPQQCARAKRWSSAVADNPRSAAVPPSVKNFTIIYLESAAARIDSPAERAALIPRLLPGFAAYPATQRLTIFHLLLPVRLVLLGPVAHGLILVRCRRSATRGRRAPIFRRPMCSCWRAGCFTYSFTCGRATARRPTSRHRRRV